MSRIIMALAVAAALLPSSPAAASGPDLTAVAPRLEDLGHAIAEILVRKRPDEIQRLAVLPFAVADDVAAEYKLGRLASEVMTAVLSARSRIDQVPGARIDAIVGEMDWLKGGWFDAQSAVAVGRLLGATRIVFGRVETASDRFIVTARVIDVQTAADLGGGNAEVPRVRFLSLAEDVIEVKSRTGTVIRSAVLPGWGQIYNGDVVRGTAYSTLFVGAAATATTFAVLGSQAEDRYRQNTPDVVGERERANELYGRAEIALLATAGIWAIAVLDAAFTGKDAVEVDRTRLELQPTGVAWRF